MTNLNLIKDIEEKATQIDTSLVAEEMINWLANNVENFIDNTMKIFRVDLVIDSEEGMLETQKLQRLYKCIPDSELKDNKTNQKLIERCQKCREMLDEVTQECFEQIKGNKALLNKLFERMIFYYEKVIPNPDSRTQAMAIDKQLKMLVESKENAPEKKKAKIQEQIVELIKEGQALIQYEKLEGFIDFAEFKYEAFGMDVTVKRGEGINGEEKEVVKDYNIPEGFTTCFEIVYKIKQRPTVMF